MTLLHVITGLGIGGAETMLAKLIEHGRGRPRQEVVSLMVPGENAPRVEAAGAPVHSLGVRQGRASLGAAFALRRRIAALRPDLVMAWMPHSQLAVAAALAGRREAPPTIWNVRHSLVDLRYEKLLTRLVLRLLALMSPRTDAIIYNSRAASDQFARFGFCNDRALVIPNGFDCEHFRPVTGADARLRRLFGIDPDPLLVGMVARAHPMKDVGTMIAAVQRARALGTDVHFLLAGRDMERPSAQIAAALAGLPPERLTLLGQRRDIPDLLPGLDLLALSSAWGEGFPNILGEALACGVPCVATDVGDSAWIIGEAGSVVSPGDVEALARAIVTIGALSPAERRALGERGRARVLERFEIGAITARYTDLCAAVIDSRRSHAVDPILADARSVP